MTREWQGLHPSDWKRADTRRRRDTDYDVGAAIEARRIANDLTKSSRKDTWIERATDGSRASTTTYAASTELQFPVVAGTYYVVGRLLFTSTSATPDVKVQVSYPASSSVLGSYWSNAGTATVIAEDATSPAITTNWDIAANGITLVQFDLVLVAGASGTFAVEWAQNTSNSTATVMKAGSFLRYRRTI